MASGGVVEYLIRIRDEASAALGGAADEADRLSDSTDDATKSTEGATKSTGEWSKGLAVLLTATVAAGKAALDMSQQVADLRNEVLDMSTRTGIAADVLAGLRLAAEGSGLQFGELARTVNALAPRMAQAAAGGNATAQAFKDLDVAVEDVTTGALRDTGDVLRDTVAALQEMPPSAERSALAAAALGEQGSKLMQALGSTDLDDFIEMAREFGVGVGPDAAKAAGDWQRAMAELDLVLNGIKASFVGDGGLTNLVEDFTLGLVFAVEVFKAAVEGFKQPAAEMLAALEQVTSGDVMGGLREIARLNAGVALGPKGMLLESGASAVSAGMEAAGPGGAAMERARGFFGQRQRIRAGKTGGTGGGGGLAAAATDAKEAQTAVDDGTRALEQFQTAISKLDPSPYGNLIELQATANDLFMDGLLPAGEYQAAIAAIADEINAIDENAFQGIADGMRAALTGVQGSLQQLSDTFDQMRAQKFKAVERGIRVAGAALGGDAGGAVSGIGQMVGGSKGAALGAVGAGLGLLQQVGGAAAENEAERRAIRGRIREGTATAEDRQRLKTMGAPEDAAAGQVKTILDGLKDSLIGALEALPEIIGTVIPEFAVALVTELIPALIKAAPEILYSLIVELPVALAMAIVEALGFDTTKQEERQERRADRRADRRDRRQDRRDRRSQRQDARRDRRTSSTQQDRDVAMSGATARSREDSRTSAGAARSARATARRSFLLGNPVDNVSDAFGQQLGDFGRAPALGGT